MLDTKLTDTSLLTLHKGSVYNDSIMNGSHVVRVNISLPEETYKEIKKHIPKRKVSSFLADAAEERLRVIRGRKALKEILAAPPTFTDIKDSVAYVRKMRRLDKKRSKRLGI